MSSYKNENENNVQINTKILSLVYTVAEQLVAHLLLIWVIALLHYILLAYTAKGCTKDQKWLRCMGQWVQCRP